MQSVTILPLWNLPRCHRTVPGATGRYQVPQDGTRHPRTVPGTWYLVPVHFFGLGYSCTLVRVHPLLSRDTLANSTKTGKRGSERTLTHCVRPHGGPANSVFQAPPGPGELLRRTLNHGVTVPGTLQCRLMRRNHQCLTRVPLVSCSFLESCRFCPIGTQVHGKGTLGFLTDL